MPFLPFACRFFSSYSSFSLRVVSAGAEGGGEGIWVELRGIHRESLTFSLPSMREEEAREGGAMMRTSLALDDPHGPDLTLVFCRPSGNNGGN